MGGITLNTEVLKSRFWAKVLIAPPHECWEWVGYKPPSGYGCFVLGLGKPSFRAHRLSWELHYGAIPTGLFVCHKCDNPGCVRPEHLFLGTNKDNQDDMRRKKRDKGFSQKNRDKQFCVNGHELVGVNLISLPKRRRCRICKSKSRRSRYLRLGK